MNDKSCDPIAELLVQYADGELPAADARRVADHLAGCPDCRVELRLLSRSLELAREVWHHSAAHASTPGLCRRRPDRRRVYASACLAACGVVLLLAFGPWLFSRRQAPSIVNTPEEVERPSPQPAKEIDVEALIAREGRSARLAAAARLLATQPGLEEYKEQAERYLAKAYRGTAAVNGALPLPSHPTKEPES